MPLPRSLLRDGVYDALRTEILTGALAPGSSLRDTDLAERFGVSKEPVRSALLRLRSEDLVVSKPQSGTRVAPLDEVAARESLELVRILSIRAAELGVVRLDDAAITEMEAADGDFREARRNGDLVGVFEADDRLHDVLLVAAGNAALRATVHQHTDVLRRLEASQFDADHGDESALRHTALIDACRRRDTDAVTRLTARTWSSLEHHMKGD